MPIYRNYDRMDEFAELERKLYEEQGKTVPDSAATYETPVVQQETPSFFDFYFSESNPEPNPATQNVQYNPPAVQTQTQTGNDKWWIGDQPTYAEYVAQLYRIKDTLTKDQYNTYAAQIDALKADPQSGFYYNPYTVTTSPYVDAISKLGIDVSGGIDDEWVAKNQYLLQGARYTDAGTTPAAPTKTSTAAQNAAYYYYQISKNWASTKEVLTEEANLKKEIEYWVNRDDINLSDDQIIAQLDWGKKYKYLQGLEDAQATGKRYNYTQPIDYNPDNLRGMIWAARNDGGTGNAEQDAVYAALGAGNIWKENKEISDKLNFHSGSYNPYAVKSTLDDAALYFGVSEFPKGWAEKAAKTIDWNNPDEVKYFNQVEKAEAFTAQAEKEVDEIYKRINQQIAMASAAGAVDPAAIEDGLWGRGYDGGAALNNLVKLDNSLSRPDKLLDTTRPINYSKKDIEDYIAQRCEQVNGVMTNAEFQGKITAIMTTPKASDNIVHGQQPAINSAPVVNQSAQAVNDAKTKTVQASVPTILSTGTSDEKEFFSLSPVVNAEGITAGLSNSIQAGAADASTLYETTAKEATDFAANHYLNAKGAITHYDELQTGLTDLQKQYDSLVKQREALAAADVSIQEDDEMPSGDWEWQLNMANLNLERQSAHQAEIEALDQQIALAGAAVESQKDKIASYQEYYDDAQSDLRTARSMADAAAMQSVLKDHPDMDLSSPAGQQALAEAKAKEYSLIDAIDLVESVGSQYKPTEWAPNTVFQYMEGEGASKDTVASMAREIIAGSEKESSALDQALAQMKNAGVDVPAAYVSNLNREKALKEREIQEAKDYLLQTEAGFEDAAEKGAKAVRNDTKHEYSELSKAILAPENARVVVRAAGMSAEMDFVKFVNAMTDDEKKTYAAILEKEGEGAAVDYFERLTDPSYGILQTRVSGKMQEAAAAFAQEMPVLATGVSILTSPMTVTGAGYTLYSLLTGQEINPYNEYFHPTIALGTMDATSKEKILEPLEEGSPLKQLAGLGYDAITSGLKSLEGAAMFGGANIVVMGLEAAGAAAQDVKMNHGTDLQAATMAGITFAAETLSEKITTQNIAEAMESGAQGVKGVLKKVLSSDMVEEFTGEAAAELVEGLSDTFVMGELSQRSQKIADYEKNMSHDEAVKQADKDFWKDVLSAGVTGALSAAGSSGISYAAGRLTATNNAKSPSPEGQVRANALVNGLPLDRATQDMTARTLTMLTSSLAANKSSQVQAVSAALFPANGNTDGQRAAVSAGLQMAKTFGSEGAVAVTQDVILSAAQEGIDLNDVKSAMTIAALGQGEASAVLAKINQRGAEFGDMQALIGAAGRDTQNQALLDRMKAIMQNDRINARERDLIGDGALNGVKPYELAYRQAMAQESKAQAALEAEQERAKVMGENLKTVQAQHVEAPDNQAVRGAMQQATKDVVGQTKVVDEYQQALERQQQEVKQAEKDLEQVRQENMTKVREQAIADVEAQVQAEAEARAEMQGKTEPVRNPNVGTSYTNDQVPVAYHYALANAADLITSNTDTGEANPAYPAELQPRDRTRAASQDQIAGMVRSLNPARLGESADVQNGAPIVGPDNVVESGNARTMAIRQAMASNPESAARYTQYLRENAARFGLNPNDVTDSSVLVRVRDTALDRAAFARAANESTTAGYSTSETAQTDAAKLTPRMMELFAPADNGRLDTTDNHAFVLDFLENVIPESERGAYMQSDGTISQQGYERIRNAVFQRAYGSTALTQALTEDTEGIAKNLLNALTKAAPRMVALQAAVEQGSVYDVGLAGKVADAAQRYLQLRNAGLSVENYLGQTTMDGVGMQTEDADTQALMQLYEQYRWSSKKLSDILGNIAYALEDAGDPRAVSFLDENAAPSIAELIRQGVQRTEAARRATMDVKANNNMPTLTVKAPEPDTNASIENLPERETYTIELPSGTQPTGDGTAKNGMAQEPSGPQRQFGSETAHKTDLLHEQVKQYLKEHSDYDPESNDEQISRAESWIQEHATEQDPEGYNGAVADVQSVDFNPFSADGQARMNVLMSMAALKGDISTETALADAYNRQGTVLGRALQARQIFYMMTPLGRQAVLLKEQNKINQNYADKGKPTRVTLSPDTLEAAGKAKTAEDFQRVQEQAYKELAEQMPPTWKDRLQAWRMLSMLGNPRTHVRNILGNAIFMPTVAMKNAIGAVLENTFVKPETGEMKTKSLTVSKENRAFAKADALKMKGTMTGEDKLNAKSKVDKERKVWGTKDNVLSKTIGKALQRLNDANSWALEAEDWVFLRKHYENALGGWMEANKLTPKTITPEQLTQAREYAIKEAQKATYRDASKVADMLSKISREGGAVGWAVDAVLPFKKTPANILKRGVEYSPVGLLRAVSQDVVNVKKYNDWIKNGSEGMIPKGALSPTQYIDRLASGLTGTAITALGYMLASMGVVTVSLDKDKKTLEELEGKQKYSLNIKIGDVEVSYTVDWAAPVCLPFFVGASIYDSMQNGIKNIEQIADSLISISEPVFNLSMLDGVNSLLQTSQWSEGNAMTQIGGKVATNYLSSFVPTVLGQVSRTIDPVRRKSYVESGASLSTMRYALEQAQNKTPFSVYNIPYRDVWGEEDRSSPWMAAFENLISPGYVSKIDANEVEKELSALFDETGDKNAVPKMASKTLSVNGQSVKLNAEQYDQYAVSRGTTAKKLFEELITTPNWKTMDADTKVEVVSDVWKVANETARAELFPNAKMTSWVKDAVKGNKAVYAILNRHSKTK